MRIVSIVLGAVLTLTAAAAPALAQTLQPSSHTGPSGSVMRITTSSTTAAPLGLQIFCMTAPTHCASAPATQLQMDSGLMSVLNSVNRSVNTSIRPQRRTTQVWTIGARVGDCKDYAMNKRAQLIARGVPAGALRLAIGFTARGEGHAVLVVRTDQGDFVLDNLTSQIKPFNQTGHTLLAMSSNDPKRWNAIS
ncbi:MAG: transglutaminase-like cysteine peptidase [Pelagibacterium sp.]|uniref:transglutaminase-like cysteine peptidase n=1 Tax=Pelagibacterium sp. TaxID=1967288 RepID=UPI0032EFB758